MGLLDIFKRQGGTKASGDYAPFYGENIWQAWLDGDLSTGKAIDPYKQIAVVYACVDKIATNISMTPFAITTGENEEVRPNQVTRLFANPYPGVSSNRMWREIVSNLELEGRAYLIYQDYLRGMPVTMWVPNSAHMKPVTRNGEVIYYEYGANKQRFEAEDVVFFNYYDPSRPLGGQSPLQALATEIDLQWYANRYNIEFFKKGGMLKGFFNKRTPGRMSPDQQKELSRRIERAGGGYKNAHSMPVLNDVEWQQIGLAQKDIEFSELMSATADRIYQAFGVPKSLFGFTETTFNNMVEAKKHFWQQTLLPKMRNIESTLQEAFFKRFAVSLKGEFATWEVPELQIDLHTAATTAKVFYDMGLPFQIINERMGLDFPDDIELESRLPQMPQMLESSVEEIKEADSEVDREKIYEEERRKRRREREKQTAFIFRLQKQDHVASIKIMDKYEEQMIPAIKRVWNKISKEVHEWIMAEDKNFTPDQITRIHNLIADAKWHELMMAGITPTMIKTFMNGQRRTYWGVGVDFNLPNTHALAHVAQQGPILRESMDAVKAILFEHLEEGGTSAQLAKKISKVVDQRKDGAKTIARTETTKAYNAGRVDSMKELGIKKKVWINAGDFKVRDEHQINGEIQLIADTFSNGQQFPGEGPASLVCNCRCTVGSVFDD